MDWTITKHALQRAIEMALDPAQIREVLNHPETVEPDARRQGNCQYHKRGSIAAVVENKTVITFLWRTELGNNQRWNRDNINLSRDS